MNTVIRVTGDASYDVVVGHGLAGEAAPILSGAATVAIVADELVANRVPAIAESLVNAGIRVEVIPIRDGELAKSLDHVGELWEAFGSFEMTRSDAVIAVGGGATTDLVGFAAATWLRGVRVLHFPTTLLGMVDAAVGGKTGINTKAGKNLVGSFHPPAGVLVDLDVLETLPDAQWVNGMAEVIKAGFIADPAILEIVEGNPAAAATARSADARALIERSIVVKANVVSADLKEAGQREFLNYGHTLAHAIERLEDYRIPHGHAVSIGMVFAAGLGRHSGRLDDVTADRHRASLDAIGLPTSYRADALPELLDVMRVDKKARGSVQRFVVLDELAKPGILENPDQAVVTAAYAEVVG